MKTYIYIITAIVLFTSCLESEIKEDEHGHGHGGHEHGEEISDHVDLSTEQMNIMEIKTGKPEKKYIANTIKASGTLELPPQNKASLSAIAEGRVKSIEVTVGQFVKKGQVLTYIENINFISLQKYYLSAKNKAIILQKDYNRKKELFKDSIVSERVLQEIENKVKQNKIEINTTKAQLDLLGISVRQLEQGEIVTTIPVRSPINGYVRVIAININTYVNTGDVIFEIVDNDHIHIDLMVFEKDVPFVREKQRVTFSIPSMPSTTYEASVFAVGKAFEEDQKALRIHAELNKHYTTLLPGMFVDATIYANDFTALTLPNESFIEEDEQTFVFVQNKDGGFSKTKVKTGKHFDDYTEIIPTKTVNENTTVATIGAFYLNSEINKASFAHEH